MDYDFTSPKSNSTPQHTLNKENMISNTFKMVKMSNKTPKPAKTKSLHSRPEDLDIFELSDLEEDNKVDQQELKREE